MQFNIITMSTILSVFYSSCDWMWILNFLNFSNFIASWTFSELFLNFKLISWNFTTMVIAYGGGGVRGRCTSVWASSSLRTESLLTSAFSRASTTRETSSDSSPETPSATRSLHFQHSYIPKLFLQPRQPKRGSNRPPPPIVAFFAWNFVASYIITWWKLRPT